MPPKKGAAAKRHALKGKSKPPKAKAKSSQDVGTQPVVPPSEALSEASSSLPQQQALEIESGPPMKKEPAEQPEAASSIQGKVLCKEA